jgi:hypothetical protein
MSIVDMNRLKQIAQVEFEEIVIQVDNKRKDILA